MAEDTKEFVFEKLFNERWDQSTATVSNPIVTVREVVEATAEWFAAHPDADPKKAGNPYAFFKDFIRNLGSANRRWPESILARNYTARQVTGRGASFEFVPLQTGQLSPSQTQFRVLGRELQHTASRASVCHSPHVC